MGCHEQRNVKIGLEFCEAEFANKVEEELRIPVLGFTK